jgi:hypothetical protein
VNEPNLFAKALQDLNEKSLTLKTIGDRYELHMENIPKTAASAWSLVGFYGTYFNRTGNKITRPNQECAMEANPIGLGRRLLKRKECWPMEEAVETIKTVCGLSFLIQPRRSSDSWKGMFSLGEHGWKIMHYRS